MLPLSVSRRRNDFNSNNTMPAPLSLPLKSSRPSLSCKALPYNGSASYYSNMPPPVFDARQNNRIRPRPTPLQFGTHLTVPVGSPMPGPSRHTGIYLQNMPQSPKSPLLDQVVTSYNYTPGPGLTFMVERKRDKSNKTLQTTLLRGVFMILVIIGLYAVAITVYGNGEQKEQLLEVMQPAKLVLEETVDFLEKDAPPIHLPQPTAPVITNRPGKKDRIRIMYSVNEDSESTLETLRD